jgi:hypothetical protein
MATIMGLGRWAGCWHRLGLGHTGGAWTLQLASFTQEAAPQSLQNRLEFDAPIFRSPSQRPVLTHHRKAVSTFPPHVNRYQ